MKNTKKRMEVFSFYDHAGISRHLNRKTKFRLDGQSS